MMKRIAVALVVAMLAGCMMRATDGALMVGKTDSDIYKIKGAPDLTSKSPSGATVYTYQAKNLKGNALCNSSFFVKDGKVVGFSERGPAVGCGGASGAID